MDNSNKQDQDKKQTNGNDEKGTQNTNVSSISDIFKRIFTTSLATGFLTGEGIKAALDDKKIPKEIKSLLKIISSSKEQMTQNIYEIFTSEISKLINSAKFQKAFVKFLETHKFKFHIDIEKTSNSHSNKTKNNDINSKKT